MSKKTYVSVIKSYVETGKKKSEMVDALKLDFPEISEKKLRNKLTPTLKYLSKKNEIQ